MDVFITHGKSSQSCFGKKVVFRNLYGKGISDDIL